MLLIDLAFFCFLSMRSRCELYRKATSISQSEGSKKEGLFRWSLITNDIYLHFCLVHAVSVRARYMLLEPEVDVFTTSMEQLSNTEVISKDTLSKESWVPTSDSASFPTH